MTPDILTQLQTSFLGAACECLNVSGGCPCPCKIFIAAGPPVVDDCECGQLSVHIERIYTHGNFPAELGTVTTCVAPLAVEMNMQLFRCYPTVKDDGTPPTITEYDNAAAIVYQDLYVLTRCIVCNLHNRGRTQPSVFRGGRIIPPSGGCIGVELRWVIAVVDPLP